MKINRLLALFISIIAGQTAFAAVLDFVNFAPEPKLVSVVAKFRDDVGNIAEYDLFDMKYKSQRRINAESDSVADPINFAVFNKDTGRLSQISISYFYGQYNASDSWEEPLWTNQVQWGPQGEKRRWVQWEIFNLERLNIPFRNLKEIDNRVLIRIYNTGKCDIIRSDRMLTIQGRLNERHKENV